MFPLLRTVLQRVSPGLPINIEVKYPYPIQVSAGVLRLAGRKALAGDPLTWNPRTKTTTKGAHSVSYRQLPPHSCGKRE